MTGASDWTIIRCLGMCMLVFYICVDPYNREVVLLGHSPERPIQAKHLMDGLFLFAENRGTCFRTIVSLLRRLKLSDSFLSAQI